MQSMVEISAVILELKILKTFRHFIFAIIFLSNACYPSFEQTLILFTQGCIVPSLLDSNPKVLKKKIFFSLINFRSGK